MVFDNNEIKNNFLPVLKQTGAVLEGTRNTYWSLTPVENFAYWGRYRGLNKAEAIKSGVEMLTEFGLDKKKDIPVKELSLGMQQIVSVCCASLANPKLLILDEPTLDLDINAVEITKKILAKLSKQEHTGIIITTHQLGFAQAVSDKVLMINHGKIVYFDDFAKTNDSSNQKILYLFKFKNKLTAEQEEKLEKFGDLVLGENANEYNLALSSINLLQYLLRELASLPITNITQHENSLEELFKNQLAQEGDD